MNRSYALVWNPRLARWTVAHEHARRRGKGAGAVIAAAALLLLPAMAFAADLPSGGQVVLGQGQIGTPNGNQMVIDQASNKLAIDWQSFDIAAGHKVTFNQPGSQSIALNRVLGADGSKIMGQLDANGRVFIVNPNGVLFGAGASVNVGGLVASTLDLSVSDFEAGNYQFKGNGNNASVINNGQITAADGGSIALLGGTVSNNGVIVANQGSVTLAAGNAMTLDFAGDGLLNVQVDEALVDALVENHQLIRADGGQVLLTANAGEALLKTVVNNTGVIEARTLGEKDGKIVLLGDFDGGTVQVAGSLDASAPNGGNGGFIDTSGAHVKVTDGAKVTTKAANGKTGKWLIDPNDFTIAASGGDMTGTAVSTAVQNNNFEIQTATMGTAGGNGDIHVNDAITWNSANTLTLNAERNINVNAAITAQHANGKVALKYGQNSSNGDTADYYIDMDKGGAINLQSGQNFSTQKGSSGSLSTYTVVNTAADLQNIGLTGNWAVGSQIDLSSIANWQPIGLGDGSFDGLGHTLSGLTIDRSQQSEVGLFSSLYNARVRNVGLVNASVMGGNYVGALVGMSTNSSISNVFATGNLTGNNIVGGLVGSNSAASNGVATINNAYASVNVTGTGNDGSGTTVDNSVGGLAGENRAGFGSSVASISHAYATGSVTANSTGSGMPGNTSAGGLVGSNSAHYDSSSANISYAYATGSVTLNDTGSEMLGNTSAGGLVGENRAGFGSSVASISHAYATGSVTANSTGSGMPGNTSAGGLVGENRASFGSSSANINYAYATGSVTLNDAGSGMPGFTSAGGLVGENWASFDSSSANINYAYWDINTSGQTTSAGGTGKTTAEMQQQSTYSGWDFSSIWHITSTGAGTDGYAFYGLPTLQGVTRKKDYQYFDSGLGTEASPWALSNWQQLQNINTNATTLAGYFQLKAELDQNSQGYHSLASATANGGAGWKPIGTNSKQFTGSFDGQNHTIGDLYINRPTEDNVGLFGATSGATLRNVGMIGGSVTGANNVGALVGHSFAWNKVISIDNVYATSNVTGTGSNVGGLVGLIHGDFYAIPRISNAYATGNVVGDSNVGGLVGKSQTTASGKAQLLHVYSTGEVTANDSNKGGLVGRLEGHATEVTGFHAAHDNGVGTVKSLVELQQLQTFANWSIDDVGGTSAIWRIYDGATTPLLRSFLKQITVTADAGNITGDKTYDGTTISGTASYTTSTPGAALDGSLGYATNSKNAGTYSTADGSLTIGGLYSGQQGYDISYASTSATLTIDKAALTVTANNASKTYDGLAFSGGNGVTYNGFVNGETETVLGGTLAYGGTAQGAINAGTYGLSASGLTADNYTLSYTDGSLTVDKAIISEVTGITAANRTYDGTTDAALNAAAAGFTGLIGSDDLSVATASGAFADKNAGSGKTVTISGITLGGTDAGNYSLTDTTATTSADIAQASISAITGITAHNRTYDGTTDATLNTAAAGFTGRFGTDDLSVATASGAFADKNAGSGKTVTISGITLGGTDAGNYSLTDTTATTSADIAQATLSIAANDASKVAGQSILLDGYTTNGLLSDDSVASVNLSSAGEPTSAAAGSYAIIASDAVGTGLGNYVITYLDGTLQVSAAPVVPVDPVDPIDPGPVNTSQPYLGVLVSNGQNSLTQSSHSQNLPIENEDPSNEPDAARPQMLATNPSDERLNLQVINRGIRLPEGI